MLDEQTIAIVKSTLPALAETGPALTAHFYDRMFHHNPELKDIFNMSNQRNGNQREALFNAISAYAANIDNLPVLLPAVERIAQKHASFTIKPDQYQIVGHHLLKTLEEMLNPGQEVLDAWGRAYGVLADVFIQREEQIYQESESTAGGWRGLRAFRVVSKESQSDCITSFTLEPQDGDHLPAYQPGQYIAVYINHPSLPHQEIRQYSLTTAPNGRYYRIAVKREDQGLVSNYLHNTVQEGDTLQLAPPHGDFFLTIEKDAPVALISAGVGQTPMLAMLHTLRQRKHQGEILWLHAAENAQARAFTQEVKTLAEELPGLTCHSWLRESQPQNASEHTGLMDLSLVGERLKTPDMHYYFCGPVGFMQFVTRQLLDMGIAPEQLHYECFGPHKVL